VRGLPTPLGFHAAGIVLHGVLAVVNLALLMWFIPDELGDEAWVRRRGRRRDPRQPPAPAVRAREAGAVARSQSSRTRSQETNAPSTDNAENSTQAKRPAARATEAVRSRGAVVLAAMAVLAAAVIVVWIRHH